MDKVLCENADVISTLAQRGHFDRKHVEPIKQVKAERPCLNRLAPDMEIVGVAASASDAVELFCQQKPELVLMDLDLPDSGGSRSIREMREIDPKVCILGIFTHPWDECAALALRAGARNCMTKDRLNRDLLTLIRECLRPGA